MNCSNIQLYLYIFLNMMIYGKYLLISVYKGQALNKFQKIFIISGVFLKLYFKLKIFG